MNTIMNTWFLLLAAAMIFVMIVRLLFHAAYREPEGRAFMRFLGTCRSGKRLQGSGYLGWIDELLDGVNFARHEFRQAVERFRRRTEWCHDEQKTFGAQATAAGMLFTLVSLTTAASGILDPTVVIAVGVMSSVYGLVIAMPGTLLHAMFQRRVDRFLDQADAVLEALDAAPNMPITAPVAAPTPIPALSGFEITAAYQSHQPEGVATHEPQTMLRKGRTCKSPHPNGNVARHPSSAAAAASTACPGLAAPSSPDLRSLDDDFEELAVDWVANANREDLDHD